MHQLKTKGVRTRIARKGTDRKFQGLGYIRQHKIHILEDSLETIKEFREYKYQLDENNNPTDKTLEINDHSIDATRYALSFALRRKMTVH